MIFSAEQLQTLRDIVARFNRIFEEVGEDGGAGYGYYLSELNRSLRNVVREPLRNLNKSSYDVTRIRYNLNNLVSWAEEVNDECASLINQTQILFTRYFPLNNFGESGRLLDPASHEEITDPVATASGYFMDRSTLNKYYEQVDSYTVNWEGRTFPCDYRSTFRPDHPRIRLNKHETIELLNNGVTLLKPDAQLVGICREFAFDKIDLAEDLQPTEKKLSRLTIAYYAKGAFELMGSIVGTLSFLALLTASIVFLAPALTPMVYGTLLGVSIFAGITYAGADDGEFQDLFMPLTSNWILVALTALLAPQAALALASYSLISSATAAAFIAAMPIILTVIPAATFVVGLVGSALFDDGSVFYGLHRALAKAAYSACYYITGAVGAVVGGSFGIAMNCARDAVVPATELLIADFEELRAVEENEVPVPVNEAPALSSVSAIANGLNIEPNVFANQQMEAPIALAADRQDEASPTGAIVIDRPQELAAEANPDVETTLNSIRLAY